MNRRPLDPQRNSSLPATLTHSIYAARALAAFRLALLIPARPGHYVRRPLDAGGPPHALQRLRRP